ncbi:MAG: helix-turn-helix transcriptional regulator [Endomicrobium sp.]|jgi:y4mF family transcriptional regulator|nr:helix-turn-helix transcriptional regulator [Endomicrobium sp.]
MIIEKSSDIAALIKEERKKQGLTQSQLAAACGVGVRFIVDLEKGKETAVIGKTLRVLLMLGIEIETK